MAEDERRVYASSCLAHGEQAGRQEITALAQAKLAYVKRALEICYSFRCKAFASIVNTDSVVDEGHHLRKDYAYLFERFYYYLEDKENSPSGIVVFDELERSRSHLLVGQMERYFKRTSKGRERSSLIIPEPFFVHSDLTTGIQLADLIAYIVSWGVRFGGMNKSVRRELASYAEQVRGLRYRTERQTMDGSVYEIWSFKMIDDLRPKDELGFE